MSAPESAPANAPQMHAQMHAHMRVRACAWQTKPNLITRHTRAHAHTAELTEKIDPAYRSPLQYYPLVKPGERFPVNDANKKPVLDPKPKTRAEYLQVVWWVCTVVVSMLSECRCGHGCGIGGLV